MYPTTKIKVEYATTEIADIWFIITMNSPIVVSTLNGDIKIC